MKRIPNVLNVTSKQRGISGNRPSKKVAPYHYDYFLPENYMYLLIPLVVEEAAIGNTHHYYIISSGVLLFVSLFCLTSLRSNMHACIIAQTVFYVNLDLS